MWNNYFFQIQKKYNMKISTKEPFIIRFDGKDVTKNKKIDLLESFEGSFLDSLIKTAKYFSKKYQCYALLGSDEISFIITKPMLVIEDFEPVDKSNYVQEVVSLFSQYFFDYFNYFDTTRRIFWHGKGFSIPEGKICSYIKYRTGIIKNVIITYFAKKSNVNNDFKLVDKEKMCQSLPGYKEIEEIKNGLLYFNGDRIDLEQFLKDMSIIKIEQKEHINKADINIDINDIEIEML